MAFVRVFLLLLTMGGLASSDPGADAFRKRLEAMDDSWAGFGIGSWVELKYTMKATGEITYRKSTLKQRDGETLVLETVASHFKTGPDGKESRVEDPPVEERFENRNSWLEGKVLSFTFVRKDVARVAGKEWPCELYEVKTEREVPRAGKSVATRTYWFSPEASPEGEILRAEGIDNGGFMAMDWEMSVEELDVTLDIADRKIPCRHIKSASTYEKEVHVTRNDIWRSKAVPGGLVRLTLKLINQGKETVIEQEVVAFEAKPEGAPAGK